MTSYAAIPTNYKGVQMRSRLEARWAAFFDMCGWQWEYEPFDLNGWIPDFAIYGVQTILVEVKPINWNDVPRDGWKSEHNTYLYSLPDLQKIINKTDLEILICGLNLPKDFIPLDFSASDIFAAIGPSSNEEDVFDFANLNYGRKGLDFHAREGSYRHRISGEYDGDHHLVEIKKGLLDSLWIKAGNTVQWKAPTPKIGQTLRASCHFNR